MNNQYVGCLIDGTCILNYIDRGYWTNFSPGGVGIWINTAGNDQYISNIVMGHLGKGQLPLADLRIQRSGGVWGQSCDFLHAQNGLLIDPSADEVTWLFLSDCAFDSCQDYCIKIDPTAAATVRGVNLVNCWSSSCLNGDGCYIAGPTHGVQFTAHRFFNNRGNGLTVLGPANSVYVDSSLVAGNSLGQPRVASGIVFTNGASGFAVRNTRSGQGINFPNTQKWGLLIDPGSTTYVVTGNDFHLNGVPGNGGPLSDGGTNKVVANNLLSPAYNP
jgi:hypothetical protein